MTIPPGDRTFPRAVDRFIKDYIKVPQPSLFPLSSEARRIPGRVKKYRCKYKTPRITWQRVEKLLNIYNDTPPAEREYNRHWYWRAHNICHNISLNTTVPMRNTVAVMAALSVNAWRKRTP